ncbi:MAG TPA: uroporphyrinogen-III C-methyltransferase [Chiayiivirga sp.]|nr:uroporphyrinogen-III C-methyltransferase [Chiayiivirga sp.]
MADIDTTDTPAPDPTGTTGPRRWPWLVLLLALFAVGARWGYLSLRAEDADRAQAKVELETLRARLTDIDRSLEQIREAQQRFSQRLDAANGTNQVLREELLGMGERAGLLEDAVARLAQSRMSGESLMRLNEAEFLLAMGAERLALYGDAGTAIQAYSLAEDALAELDDPALATLRQTLTQELIQLRDMPPDPRPPLRAELTALAQALPQLPDANRGEVARNAPDGSRLARLLGQIVTVRRVDPATTPLGPAQRQAALAAIALQFELAQAALARPDADAFRAVLDRIEQAARTLFDSSSPALTQWLQRLTHARETALLPTPPVLGATLRELRALRAARSLRGGTPLRLAPLPHAPAHPASDSVPPEVESSPEVEAAAPHREGVPQ